MRILTVVLVSADTEWRAVRALFPESGVESSPLGDWLFTDLSNDLGVKSQPVIFFHTRLLILRGVSDLVGSHGGEAYGNMQLFAEATGLIMERLVAALLCWIARAPVLEA